MSIDVIYFEDLFVGRRLETDWQEMTRDAIVEYAQIYDPQPFHLTDDGGKASAFGRLVASGIHTFAFGRKGVINTIKTESR